MKTVVISSPLITSENVNGSVMGMDANGMNTATYLMRDKIYSNKILAVVREYACNALDEHKKYGIKQNVDIGVRTEGNDYTFFCRDYARGLDEDGVRNIFGMYFRSTKSNTNDAIGGFGIGSKAGHCYGDTFFVTSYHDGIKSTYTCMLGGGETGIPVGHIYKIDECPTDESGLEISLPISEQRDAYAFEICIKKMVSFSTGGITQNCLNGEKFHNPTPIAQKKIENFDFRLIETDVFDESYKVYLQMGGVVYETKNLSDKFKVKDNHAFVVDIPIGMMSIPISRESFENTTSNQNVINKIFTLIEDLSKEDLDRFKDKNILELIDDALGALSSQQYIGDWFSIQKPSLFKDVWRVVSNVSKFNDLSIETKNNKPILVLIPDNTAANYWRDKTSNFCKSNNKNYYYVCEKDFYRSDKDQIEKYLEVIFAKKLPFPKVKKAQKTYKIEYARGFAGNFNPLDLHNYARRLNKLPEAADEQEAIEQNKEFFAQDLCDKDLLNHFTICLKNNYPHDKRKLYVSNSAAFHQEMIKIGWLGFNSKQYQDLSAEIAKKEQEIDRFQSLTTKAKKSWVELSEKTTVLINKNVRNAERVSSLFDKIIQEDSLRSKVLRSFDRSYYFTRTDKLSRADLRNILKMK
jgi:hypothetical protein